MIWGAVTAQLDGRDPWSSDPIEKMRCLVHQRRQYIDVLRTRALCYSAIGAEKAAEILQEFESVVMPIDPEAVRVAEAQRESEVEEIARMEPISLSDIRFGGRIGGQ